MIRNQKGQGMVEYILIIALVVVGGIGLWLKFGNKVTTMLETTNTKLDTAIFEQNADKDK